MTARIVLAPIGADKTDIALRRLTDILEGKPLARVWVLLPTKRQEDAFRQRLAEWDDDRRIYFNIEFFNFYELYERLLDMAGWPVRALSDAARAGLLRGVIRDLAREGLLAVFGRIAHTPGFVRVVAELVDELKQGEIDPRIFAERGVSAKDAELARIYDLYQQRLQQYNLVDIDGQGWLSAEAVQAAPGMLASLELLLVDGFDQFTPLQAHLLKLLADQAAETLITLTTVPVREQTVGRRFLRTLRQLEEQFAPDPLLVEILTTDSAHDRPADLRRLIDQVFRLDSVPQPAQDGITLLEAPDPAHEVRAVLRRVKRLLLDGVAPDEVLIALRDWERYYPHFSTYSQVYGLPLALHYGYPLKENPAIAALLNLLALHEQDFPRSQVIDILHSPYFKLPGFTQERIALLERISLRFMVTGGRGQWLDAVERASRPLRREDADGDEALLSGDEAADLYHDLSDFFNAVTPPPHATTADYILWLELLIGQDPERDRETGLEAEQEIEQEGYTLDMIAALRADHAPAHIAARDAAAMQTFKTVLRSLLVAREVLRPFEGEDGPAEWSAFAADLTAAVGAAAVAVRPNRAGRVLVTTATDARGLPHRHVFVLGLSEGIFPAQIGEDPLYLDHERQRLGLLTRDERAADDGLFYELICQARDGLTLSRPAVRDGNPWMESHLWRGVTALFSDSAEMIAAHRLGSGQVAAARDAATLEEAALAVSDELNQPLSLLGDSARGTYNWFLRAAPAYWGHLRRARAIEARRMDRSPFDRFSGVLDSPALLAYISDELGPARVWSATQFNEFGACGFRFFASRLLKLEALEEPEAGMTVSQRGTLYHDILEKTYKQVREFGLNIAPENTDKALHILNGVSAEIFDSAPETIGFREEALWPYVRRELHQKLIDLVTQDFNGTGPADKHFAGENQRQPYWLEIAFGLDGGRSINIDLGDEVGPVRVHGYIDRIDVRDGAGIIIDYKSGSTPIRVDEMETGRNAQMLLYLMAAERLLGDEGLRLAGGMFWHLSSNTSSGALRVDEDGQQSIDRAISRLADHVWRARRGDFAVSPSKPEEGRCVRYCEFSRLCRVAITQRAKAGPR